jgi:hypothetical protein
MRRSTTSFFRTNQKKTKLHTFEFFSFFWSIALIFHVIQAYSVEIYSQQSIQHILFLICCLVLLVNVKSIVCFFVCALMVLIVGWDSFPRNISNHFILEFFFCAGVVIYCVHKLYRKRSVCLNKHSLFNFLAATGRYLLIILYFFGVFHKLNTDWFDPSVSCAARLWESFFWKLPSWLEDSLWAKTIAIYGTLIIEAAIIVILLWFPSFSKYAVCMGLFFHGIIGLNAYAHYWNFSALSFALHFLFIPKSTSKLFAESKLYDFFSRGKYKIFLFKLFLISIFLFLSWCYYKREFHIIYWFWLFFIFITLIFFLMFTKYHKNYREPIFSRKISATAVVIAVLFFINCLSPYIGFKTESSIAMYSNLFTELGRTNHLLFDKPPYIFDFQNQVVQIKYSSDNKLNRLSQNAHPILLHQLRQHVKRRFNKIKNDSILYTYNGKTYFFDRIGDDKVITNVNYFLYKLLVLKPVDVSSPKRCTH